MELKWLEDLLILFEEGSFTKAAVRRNVTQPAFSRRIQSIEQWLGTAMVDRNTQPVTILDSARRMEPEIRALARRMQELKGQFRSAANDIGRLDFAAQHTLAVAAFPQIMGKILQYDNHATFRLRSGNTYDCITTGIRGDADFLLIYEAEDQPNDVPDHLFERIFWERDRLLPVIGGGLKYNLDQDALLPTPVPLLSYPASSFLGVVLEQCILSKITPTPDFEWVCSAGFTSSIKEMCISGMGLAWLPHSLIWRELQNGTLVSMEPKFPYCELQAVLYVRKTRPNSAELIEHLRFAQK